MRLRWRRWYAYYHVLHAAEGQIGGPRNYLGPYLTRRQAARAVRHHWEGRPRPLDLYLAKEPW